MSDSGAGRFTVGVFQDVAWAANGIHALLRAGLLPESLTVLGLESPAVSALIAQTLAGAPESLQVAGLGAAVARGPLIAALQGTSGDLRTLGLSGTMRRVGFQAHDARIFEALTAKGGVLHAYGGGNAAIGAWTGRV